MSVDTMQVCCIGRDEIIAKNHLLAALRRYAFYPFFCFLREDHLIYANVMDEAKANIDDVRLEVEHVRAPPLTSPVTNINITNNNININDNNTNDNDNKEIVTNLLDKSSSVSSSGGSGSGSGSSINHRRKNSAQQQYQYQHAQKNHINAIPVRTEFVYADGGKDAVQLCGDWNRWAPISMELESGKLYIYFLYVIYIYSDVSYMFIEGIWSVITVVPSGYREFCYIVDGIYHVSKRHPSNSDSTCNWRVVNGPPSSFIRRRRNERFRILRMADQAAAYLRMFILYYFYPTPDHTLPHIVTDTFAPIARKKHNNVNNILLSLFFGFKKHHSRRAPYRIAALFLLLSLGSILYFRSVPIHV